MDLDLQFVDSIGQLYDPVSDTFSLPVANGWGTSDTGHVWTTSGGSASDYSVTGTRGRISLGSVGVDRYTITGSGLADVNITALFISPPTATGAPIAYNLLARVGDSSNFYALRVSYDTAGTVDLNIDKRIGGTFTTLANVSNFAAYTPGSSFLVRMEVVGTTIRGKIWAGTEPSTWAIQATDSDRTSGGVGFRAILQSGNTNTLPTLAEIDNLSVASPTQVRLDLDDGLAFATQVGTDFGMPSLSRAVSSTLLTDGDHVAAAAYGNRMLTLVLKIAGGGFDDDAEALQVLSREINRPTNFLRYRPGTTEPVFFRTIRSDYGSVVWDAVQRLATVNVLAEPFAYGLPEFLPAVTVSNDPAAVSNGMFFDVTGIKGDVPAATKIQTDLAFYNNRMLIATRRRGTPANLQFAYQAESMTQGTNTTTQPNDAAMSGAGNNFSRCTFAAATMQTRLTLAAFPASIGLDGRGTYRVLARVRKSVSGDVINMRLVVNATFLDKTTLNTTSSLYHEDLGLLSVPFGTDPVTDGPSGMELDAAQYAVQLQAERVSGTGTLDIDYLLFIPADDELAFVEFGPDTFGDGYVFDSHHDMVYAVKAGAVDTSDDIIPIAGLPTLRPGVTNRIYLVQGIDVIDAADTCTAAVTTWPRYLSVRGTS